MSRADESGRYPIVGVTADGPVVAVNAHTVKLADRKPRGVGKNGRKLEGTIQAEILAALNGDDDVQLWRNNTGALPNAQGRLITYGLAPGSSDLIGIVLLKERVFGAGGKVVGGTNRPHVGRFIAIEVKREGETPKDDQLLFIDRVRAMGGAACWVDNAADAIAFVERVKGWIE